MKSPSVPTISIEELAGVGDPHGVGAEGAQPHHAELGVAAGDRVAGAPLQVGEAAGVDEVDLRLERRLEAVVPVLERRQDRHVVGLELVEPGTEDVGELALVDEDRGLALAHGELGAVLDRVALALEAPDDGVAGVVGPVDDVDELAAQEIQDRHRLPPCQLVATTVPSLVGGLGGLGVAGDGGQQRAGLVGGHAGAEARVVEHAQQDRVVLGQQRELEAVVEERGPRLRAVVGQAHRLGHLLVDAGEPGEGRVLGADQRRSPRA